MKRMMVMAALFFCAMTSVAWEAPVNVDFSGLTGDPVDIMTPSGITLNGVHFTYDPAGGGRLHPPMRRGFSATPSAT